VYGGGDPVDVVKRHGGRIAYVHLKDVRAAELQRVATTDIAMEEAWRRGSSARWGRGWWTSPGRDLPARPRVLGWMVVEQDVVPDAAGRLEPEPFASARKSRTFLREVVGL